jgi:hypothetical protein
MPKSCSRCLARYDQPHVGLRRERAANARLKAIPNIVENGVFKTKANDCARPNTLDTILMACCSAPRAGHGFYNPSNRYCRTPTCHHEILHLKYGVAWDGKMPHLFDEEGLIVPKGIFRDATQKDQVADFSYSPNDSLAQMIVDAWVNADFKSLLLNPANAKAVFATRGFYWNGTTKKPVVISEDDYNKGYTRKHHNEIVFVLPNHDGTCPAGQNLLDTAKLLMAATPNGI